MAAAPPIFRTTLFTCSFYTVCSIYFLPCVYACRGNATPQINRQNKRKPRYYSFNQPIISEDFSRTKPEPEPITLYFSDIIIVCLLSTALPPPPRALWFGCVVGVNAVMFLSFLHRSVILPLRKLFRTRSASLWMLSKCFCREPWGGLSPAGFYSSFRQVHGDDSVKSRETRICTVHWLKRQDACMLWAQSMWIQRFPTLFLFFRRKTRYLLLWDPAMTWSLCSTL